MGQGPGITNTENMTTTMINYTVNAEIKRALPAWDRIEALYEHNEPAITEYCKRFPNESKETFANRKSFYSRQFINPTTDLISGPVNTIVTNGCTEEFDNEKGTLRDWSLNVTQGEEKISLTEYIAMFVLPYLLSYGNVIIVIDKPQGIAANIEQEKKNYRPYLCMVRPQDIMDWQKENGELLWITYKVKYQKPRKYATDPLKAVELVYEWNRTELIVRENNKIRPDLSHTHNWGFVPVVLQAAILTSPKDTIGKSTFFETSNMLLTYNDHLSKLNSDIYKSINRLVEHEDSIGNYNSSVDANGRKIEKMADNNSKYYYSGDKPPEYIKMEIDIKDKLDMAIYYFEKAVENERDAKSVQKKGATGSTVAESGISKIVDRDPIEAKLDATAKDGEAVYHKIMNMINKIFKKDEGFTFEYNKDYNLTPMSVMIDNIVKAESSKLSAMTETGYKKLYKNLTPLLTDDKEEAQEINNEIESSNIESFNDMDIKLEEMEDNMFEKKEKVVEEVV